MTPPVHPIPDGDPTHLLVDTAVGPCALPLEAAVEVMRPGRVDPIPGVPPWILGAARVRGETRIVLDLGRLLGGEGRLRRWVRVRSGGRQVVLAVGAVRGVVGLEAAPDAADPLLGLVDPEAVSALSRVDGDTVLLLQQSRLVSEARLPPVEERP